jgi:murein lipoprotein
MRKIYKTAATGAMLVALAGVTGCATTSDLNALRADLDKVSATANKAAADAATAKSDAAAAKAAAAEANATANATSEKLDRMFKKSMNK